MQAGLNQFTISPQTVRSRPDGWVALKRREQREKGREPTEDEDTTGACVGKHHDRHLMPGSGDTNPKKSRQGLEDSDSRGSLQAGLDRPPPPHYTHTPRRTSTPLFTSFSPLSTPCLFLLILSILTHCGLHCLRAVLVRRHSVWHLDPTAHTHTHTQ